MYPLSQYDPELPTKVVRLGYAPAFKSYTVDDRTPLRDYTPPELVSYLWTDLGVLTTAAVSDELIKLYS
jgi:translation initiation factor eIF-2B subunit alpha